ncbi:MAG: hypothetical protein U9N45_05755, partial [Gemmatimonadota bacterium]|nr:hypothetical protein [Gemmatimonadota bacterium]
MQGARIICTLVAVLVSINFSLAAENKPDDKNPKVLLVYSSGEPCMRMAEFKRPEDLEGVTTPTPRDMNSHIAAERVRNN